MLVILYSEVAVIVTVAYATIARLFSFIFTKSNSFPTLVDLLLLSYLILSYLTHAFSHSFPLILYLPFKCADLFKDITNRKTGAIYS